MANKNENLNPEKFRDALGTVNKEGGRNWVYPKKVSGKFY